MYFRLVVVIIAVTSTAIFASAESNIYNDGDGNLHIRAASGNVFIEPGNNGNVFVGDVDIQALVRQQTEIWESCYQDKTLSSPTFSPSIFVLGGFDSTSYVDTVDVLQSNQTWRPSPAYRISRSRSGLRATVFRGRLFVFGGANRDWLGDGDVFDGHVWSMLPVPTPRQRIGVVVFQDRLYAIGGEQTGGSESDVVEIYDGDTWTRGPPMPAGRDVFGIAVFRGKIFVIGGATEQERYTDAVHTFDGVTWDTAPSMLTPRLGLAATVYKNILYAIGGMVEGPAESNRVEAFDGTGWTLAPPMPTARALLGLVVFHDELYAMGGSHRKNAGGMRYLDVVEVFNGTAWSTAPPMPTIRSSFAAAVYPPET